ncbi:MAG: hypothetical protein FWE28_08455 [Oscillospiraceae bacterium]|nr:hypothetical protein [Oscillospiraceae bacterium]
MLIFCFFLFNDKKKARPAGHNKLAVTRQVKIGGNAEPENKTDPLLRVCLPLPLAFAPLNTLG